MKSSGAPVWLYRCVLLLALGACGQAEGPSQSASGGASESQPEDPSERVPKDVFGEYRRPHQIGVFNGETWVEEQVQDRLVLRAGPGAQVTFEIDTVAENAHTCSLTGVADPADGSFEYREVLDLPADEDGRPFECILRMRAEDGRVVLEDIDHGCRLFYCGMRASLDGLSFERAGPGAGPRSPAPDQAPQL